MKFTLLTVAGLVSAIAKVSADITVVTPWAQTTWTSGGHGLISWNATGADAGLKCDMYLLNGVHNNSNIVAQITDPATPFDCNAGQYDIYPLNDFASGQYWIRIGQASTGTWAYSAAFNFVGNGSSNPISLASTATGAPAATGTAAAAASAKGGVAAASGKPAASAAASGAASSSAAKATTSTSGASSISASGAAVALGAIAAVAFNL